MVWGSGYGYAVRRVLETMTGRGLGALAACATANQAVKRLTPEQRLELEMSAARIACSELPADAGSPEVRKLCDLLTAE